jgi:choline dehydrogenase
VVFDYVIVGAGSSGCALAARLSEDPDTRVLLLEAGGVDDKREIRIPITFSTLFHTECDWDYHTVPQRHLNDRQLYWPRGKVLGGSSSINAMMWVRGVPADYDRWAEQGAHGWGYADALAYFRRIEDAARADPEHQGSGGPITLSEQRSPNPGTHLFVDACRNAGIPRNLNANAGTNEGVDYTVVSQRRGARWSVVNGYLNPAMRRPNLTVATRAQITQVLIEDGRAVGVAYLHDGRPRAVNAAREVVLAAGAINSPQVLMLSGIGPADELTALGIHPVVDLPGVGRNLLDHLSAGVIVETSRTDTLLAARSRAELAKYALTRRGMLTSNVAEAHAFIRSGLDLQWPDLELLFAPVPFLDHGRGQPPSHGYTLGVILLQPKSSGTVRLASADPLEPPLIDPNYFAEPDDVRVAVTGMRKAAEVLSTAPLAEVVGAPIHPRPWPQSDEEWVAAARAGAETLYHPVGTCRMGVDDLAVVDPQLRVRGVDRLRVADASVMPSLIRGHTNAPAIMIGEKAANLLRTG